MRIPVDRLAPQEIVYRLPEPEDKWPLLPVLMPAGLDSRISGGKSLFGVRACGHDGLRPLLRVLQTVPVLADLALCEPWGSSRSSVGVVGNRQRAAAHQVQ
jgi:hypothetical protein